MLGPFPLQEAFLLDYLVLNEGDVHALEIDIRGDNLHYFT